MLFTSKFFLRVFVSLTFSLICYFRIDSVIGQFSDDAWYLLIAKALATGKGYNAINSLSEGVFPTYPPFYPILLSFVWQYSPNFPGNVTALKLVSIIALIGSGVFAYKYLIAIQRIPSNQCLLIVSTLLLSPAYIFLATSTLMSECVCSLFLIVNTYLVQNIKQYRLYIKKWLYLGLIIFTTSATVLTKSSCLGLSIAIALYLFKEKLLKEVIVFCIGFGLCAGSWYVYAQQRRPTQEQIIEQAGNIVYTYSQQFWMNMAGDPESGEAKLIDISARVYDNILNITLRDTGCLFLPFFYRDAESSGIEALGLGKLNGKESSMGFNKFTMMISCIFSLMIMLGYFNICRENIGMIEVFTPLYLLTIIIWPWFTFRFTLLLFPFLLNYLICGIAIIASYAQSFFPASSPNIQWAITRNILISILFLMMIDHTAYILSKNRVGNFGPPFWITLFNDTEKTLNEIKNKVGQEQIIATDNAAQVALYTNHKTIGLSLPEQRCKYLLQNQVIILAQVAPLNFKKLVENPAYKKIYLSPFGLKVFDVSKVATCPLWKVRSSE